MDLRSGGILEFSGRSLESLAIRARDFCRRTSHVGILGRRGGETLLWESTTLSDLPCVICGRNHSGVQAVRVCDRVSSYNGRIWYAGLTDPLDESEEDDLAYLLARLHGLPYDRRQAYLSARWFRWLWGSGYDERAIFCAELVIKALQRVGRVARDTSPSAWRPTTVMRRMVYWGAIEAPERLTEANCDEEALRTVPVAGSLRLP